MHVIDSHTGGEPTRVILSGGPDLGSGPLQDRAACLAKDHVAFYQSVMCEPRGQPAMVGALLVEPVDPDTTDGVDTDPDPVDPDETPENPDPAPTEDPDGGEVDPETPDPETPETEDPDTETPEPEPPVSPPPPPPLPIKFQLFSSEG